MPRTTGLGMFLSRRETVKNNNANSSVVKNNNNNKQDDGTVATASVTEASRWSLRSAATSLHDSFTNRSHGRFVDVGDSTHNAEEEEEQSVVAITEVKQEENAIEAFKALNGAGVEKVWFTSVTERFQRFQQEEGQEEEEDTSLLLGTLSADELEQSQGSMHFGPDELEDVFEVSDEDQESDESSSSSSSVPEDDDRDDQEEQQDPEWFDDADDAFHHYSTKRQTAPSSPVVKKSVSFDLGCTKYHTLLG